MPPEKCEPVSVVTGSITIDTLCASEVHQTIAGLEAQNPKATITVRTEGADVLVLGVEDKSEDTSDL